MADCCKDKSCAIKQLQERQSGALKVGLGINVVMFVVFLAADIIAAATSTLARSEICTT